MRQRVNLARALAIDPEILLMDEPFASLDAQTREIMQAELLAIRSKAKKTVLFITHQINEAVFLSDRVIVFSSRPGYVKEEIKIELPRPRHLTIKTETRFLDYERSIWDIIEGEVKKTMLADRTTRDGSKGVVDPEEGG
jgi:NitT/TauT family transport system ATP-binding protein